MARNASGTYSLPSGNPVSSGATIESAWANTTLSDVATGITNSLDRQGRGGMLAPLRVTDESAATPAWSFTNEVSSGFYRSAAGDVRFSLLTADLLQFKSAWANLWDGAAWQPIVAVADGTADNELVLWDTGGGEWVVGDVEDLLPTATEGQTLVKGASIWEASDAFSLKDAATAWIGDEAGTVGLEVVGFGFTALNANAQGDAPGTVNKALAVQGTTLTLNATSNNLNLQAGGTTYFHIGSAGGIFMDSLGSGSGTDVIITGSDQILAKTSSRRFKEAIEDYPDAIAELFSLRPRVYRRKGSPDLEGGFIAEEMHDAGLVKYVNYRDGKPFSVKYGELTSMIVAALQQGLLGTTAAPAA